MKIQSPAAGGGGSDNSPAVRPGPPLLRTGEENIMYSYDNEDGRAEEQHRSFDDSTGPKIG